MTDRIDDLIQRLIEAECFEFMVDRENAERIIRQWAGEQQQVVADKEIEQVANDESQQDWNDLSYRGIHREAFISGARWMRDKSNVASTTTPQPVADGCDCGRHVDENGDQIHYSNCPLSNKPVAGDALGAITPIANAYEAGDVREKIEKAMRVVEELCDGKRRWVMQVPADPNNDPDLVIMDALIAARKALLRPEPGNAPREGTTSASSTVAMTNAQGNTEPGLRGRLEQIAIDIEQQADFHYTWGRYIDNYLKLSAARIRNAYALAAARDESKEGGR